MFICVKMLIMLMLLLGQARELPMSLRAAWGQWCSQATNFGEAKCFILGEWDYFVWKNASQSTKWLYFLKIGGAWPLWPYVATPMYGARGHQLMTPDLVHEWIYISGVNCHWSFDLLLYYQICRFYYIASSWWLHTMNMGSVSTAYNKILMSNYITLCNVRFCSRG